MSAPALSADDERTRGLVLVLVAGALYSTAGLFVRALPYDAWTMLAWRAVFGALFTFLWLVGRDGRQFARAFVFDRVQWATMPLVAVGGICYIAALKITTVADVMVVYATLPFVVSGVAWVWFRDVPSSRTLLASAAAILGVSIMVAGSFGTGHRLAGIALVLLMNVGFGVVLVGARHHPGSSLAQFTVGTLLSGLVAWPLAQAGSVSLPGIAGLALFGVTTIGLAMTLYMVGARLIPPAEVALLGTTDVILGPVLVWVVFGEAPGLAASIGGVVVIAALLWHLWPDLRRARRPRAADAP